ncbi:MAG: hypothetical protein LBJ14_08060 [Desulfarculales bacterium]|jgi:hypothetical protein|nr:hypothetical protein [Desulfarculales bacterium]
MAITAYQVQNILKTYARQLARGHRLAKAKSKGLYPYQLQIDVQARRRRVIEKITAELIDNLGMANFSNTLDDVELLAMRTLSKEYGQPLALMKDDITGTFKFKVQSADTGNRELSDGENAKLENRLYAITQNIIEHNMV